MAGAERAIEYAVEKFGKLLADEIKLVAEARDDVLEMQDELRMIKGCLADADAKGKNGDHRTKIWISDVTNVAHEIEDVVDTFMYHFETKKQYVWKPSKLGDLHYIGHEIKRIKTKIDKIRERKDRYGINNLGEPGASIDENLRAQRNINPHLSGNNIFVGFGGPKKLILERLIDPKVKKRVVVPIVGMGGLGKTTLATQIYNDDVTKDWFKYRAWGAVSEAFKPLELLRKIIKQVLGDSEKYNSMDVEELKVQVHDCLKGQRYFVVLDDIWEQDQDVWLQLKGMFPDVDNGSRVLVTTRFIGVGKSIDPSNEPYVLPFLEHKESWQLFLNIVFPSKDGSEPKCIKELETLGKDLVKKCGGLPLGVKMLGGLLSATGSTVNAWNKVVNAWNNVAPKLYLQILALSYKYLPNVNMKSCFLYIGIYPEDHIIKASELTKFWIAEGFIPKEENQTFEETAKDYLDEFVLRCMVQVVARTKTSKRVKFFRIHDLFRKWCISEAREDGFFRIWNSNCDTTNSEIISARRLIIYNSTLEDKFNDLSYKARAILGFNDLSVGNFLLSNIGQNFKLLRVVYLTFSCCEKINKSKSLKQISRLIHLRNITLKSKALTYLPSSIGKLRNLQSLNVKHTSILKLPKTLHEIHDLRHLYTRGSSIKSSSTWKSTNLQTLDSISAGSLMLNDFTKLLNLRKLSICGIAQNEEVRRLQDSLCRLNHLKSLCLESDGQLDPSLFASFNHDHPLSKLVLINWSNISCNFPQNLISIRLSSCTFEKGVLASLANLSGLVNLKLEDCGIHPEDKFAFSANDFHQLENLHIDEMRSSLDWEILDGALPKIKCLTIRALEWLAMLPDGLKHLKSLQKLEMVFPNNHLESRLIGTLEDRHKIPQIPSVTLNGIQLDQRKWAGLYAAPVYCGAPSYIQTGLSTNRPMSLSNFQCYSEKAPSFGSGRVSGRIIRSSEEMIDHDDEPILSSQDVSGGEHVSYVMGRTKLTIIKTMVAPLNENKYNVMLEVMGLNHVGNRPGVDFVTVLDVDYDNLVIMKSAMKFFIQKLSSNDRLSIIIMSSSARPIKIFPLRQITESFLVEVGSFENIPDVTTAMKSAYRNITACIKKGLEVLSNRRFTTGRKAAIMLMSDGIHNFYDYSIPYSQFLNIPVYTFGLREDCDPRVLKLISSSTMGGTFSYIRNSNDLSIAFSQSFSDLFGVATQDLKLTLKQIESTILTVFADNYTQSTDAASEIVTIHFGDLYVNELRKLALDLFLPAVKSHCSNDVLEITSRDADAVVQRSILIDVARCEVSAERDMDDYEPDDGEKLTIHPA